ncbi:hypothetical protein D9Q98_000879 [Chlorella vulgaris]|uniref:Uncharacterized protein n=1 Tax=Chlorella vulgaris TaxID=3077 RepID=A0A9D4TZH9_CHLVU|nr:hypothetical protein D9Q98_000879 [Chlorella vulgaris]
MAGTAAGAIEAAVHNGDECLLTVTIPSTGLASSSIAQLKQETMTFMTNFMRQKNMSLEEVDLMEEVVASDDEQKGSMQPGKKAKGQAGQKRKQHQTAAKA